MFNVVGHDAQADVCESTTDSRDQFTAFDRGVLIMILEVTQNSRENIVGKTLRDMSPPGRVPKSLTKPVRSQQDQSAGAEMDERKDVGAEDHGVVGALHTGGFEKVRLRRGIDPRPVEGFDFVDEFPNVLKLPVD